MSYQTKSTKRLIEGDSNNNKIWMPNFRSCFRLLLIARVISALYSNITDCDETYNYWEPLHLLTHSPFPFSHSQTPFQTWEYSPQFAIRSWAYIVQYVPIAGTIMRLLGKEKSASFYATRTFLAFCSSMTEAAFLQTISDVIHPQIARYTLVLLLFSAGLFESSTALLPSTFVMYTTTWAMSFAFKLSTEASDKFPLNRSILSSTNGLRTLAATAIFALGALLAWPFALILALPFVFEELFLPYGLIVPTSRYLEFILVRSGQWIKTVLISALIAIPIVSVDSLAYARLAIVPLNIITYNVLSARRGAGPELYGVEPWYYYLLNLALNFGPALLFALISLPMMILLSILDPERISFASKSTFTQDASKKKSEGRSTAKANVISSSPGLLLTFRLLPFYLWLGLLTLQAHKEERFVYPAYPILCFNAAVGLYSLKSFIDFIIASLIKGQQNKPSTSRHQGFSITTLMTGIILAVTCLISISRSFHTTRSYNAPFDVLRHLSEDELPRVIRQNFPMSEGTEKTGSTQSDKEAKVDLSLLLKLKEDSQQEEPLRLCYGKEWYRFPSTYLVPDGVKVDFITSEFRGILPKHFARGEEAKYATIKDGLSNLSATLWPWGIFTQPMREGFNDLNREETDRYVGVNNCDYLVDVDWTHRYADQSFVEQNENSREPRYLLDKENWTAIYCTNFLDASWSRANPEASKVGKVRATIERAFHIPNAFRGQTNRYGQYCLLRTKRANSVANSVYTIRS
jgi:alpha-1,2-mannosyltransferase